MADRLTTDRTVLKNLFAQSGNQCAFDGCGHPVVDEFGNVVAQVAHIAGVKPGAARYDSKLDANDLRQADNLLILCNAHHIATNDVALYPVPAMRRIKERHEARFARTIEDLAGEVVDKTTKTSFHPPQSYEGYMWEYGLAEDDIADVREGVQAALDRLVKFTPEYRTILASVVTHGKFESDTWTVPWVQVEDNLSMDSGVFSARVDVLINHGLLFAERSDTGYIYLTMAKDLGGSNTNMDLHAYMINHKVSVGRIFQQLDWRFFDSIVLP